MPDQSKEPWHLDRRVPIATLAVLLVQFSLGVAWLTTLSNSVGSHTGSIAEMRADGLTRKAERDRQLGEHEVRIRQVELMQASQSSDLRAIQSGISRIEAQLEKLQLRQ